MCHYKKFIKHKEGIKGRTETQPTRSPPENVQKTNNKIAIPSHSLSVITLNINELNSLIERHRSAEWTEKQDLTIFYLQEAHFRSVDTHRLKMKG